MSHRWVAAGQSISLLYIAFMAARSVGANTPNNSTNSISDIQTLLSGIFTLPFSLIVIITRSIPIHNYMANLSQTLLSNIDISCSSLVLVTFA